MIDVDHGMPLSPRERQVLGEFDAEVELVCGAYRSCQVRADFAVECRECGDWWVACQAHGGWLNLSEDSLSCRKCKTARPAKHLFKATLLPAGAVR